MSAYRQFILKTLLRSFLLTGILFHTPLAAQIRVTLKNGDYFTASKVTSNTTTQTVLIESPILGNLTLKQSDIASTTTLPVIPPPAPPPKPATTTNATIAAIISPNITVTQNASLLPPAGNTTLSSPATGNTTVAATPKPSPPPAPPPAAKPPAVDPNKPAPWKGKFEIGFNDYTGRRDLTSIYARIDAEKKIRTNTHTLYARYLYSEQNNVKNSDRGDATYRYRHDISAGSRFLQAQSLFFHDGVAGIAQNYEQNASIGFRLLQHPKHIINVTSGLTAQYRDYENPGGDDFNLLLEAGQDYTYKINTRFTFLQNASAQYAPGSNSSLHTGGTGIRDATNYKYRFNAAIQGKITQLISLNLRFEYEYDNAIYTEEARTDQRIIATLGYNF